MTAVVDASVWVSRLVPADVFHTVSQEWLASQTRAGEPLVTPALMLAEVAGAISRRTGMPKLGQQAVDSLLRLRARRLVAVDGRLGREAARLAPVAGLCREDAVYTALARHLSIPLVTWDDELQQRAGPVLVVQRPASPSPLA